MHKSHSGNHLLDAVPYSKYSLLKPHLKAITMNSGDVLHQKGKPIHREFIALMKSLSAARNTMD